MDRDSIKKTFKELTELHGVAGSEELVMDYIAESLADTSYSIRSDAFGNLIVNPEGEFGYNIGIYAHMDEVGLIVRRVTDAGLIYFDLAGNIDEKVMPGSEWDILTTKGTIVRGVIGNKSRHLQSAADKAAGFTYKDLAIDIGANNADEVHALGIETGCPIAFTTKCTYYEHGAVLAKAIDDRVGCLMLIEALKRLDGKLKNSRMYGFFTAQEEVGAKGAKVAGHNKNLNVIIALDTVSTENRESVATGDADLNKGPVIRLSDWHLNTKMGMFSNKTLVKMMKAAAEENGIRYQTDLATGTFLDSSTAQFTDGGVAGISLTVPRRYSHTATELSNMNDIYDAIDLLCAFIQKLDEERPCFEKIYK